MPKKICVFANFNIDTQERLQRMMDSFVSFRNANISEWKINIRGSLKHQAADFLGQELGDELTVFFWESKKGWFFDSLEIAKVILSDYVFFWVEDHICQVEPTKLNDIVEEMQEFDVDQVWYSFLHHRVRAVFDTFPVVNVGKHITCAEISNSSCRSSRKALGYDFYVTTMVSIMTLRFFKQLLLSPKPYLKRHSMFLPFDFERKASDSIFGRIVTAIPKEEIFAAIDDDHKCNGYSLISRGKYPNRITWEELKKKEMELGISRMRLAYRKMPISFRLRIGIFTSLVRKIIFTIQYHINKQF